jgi:hypothetical protein
MAFECNIDARGKAARIRLGIVGIIGSFLFAGATLFGVLPTTIGWIMSGGSFLGGAFSIWEGRKGWCIVRAMGFKTKI